jgi:hypothetical protein
MKDFITQQQVDKEKQRQEQQNIHNDKKAIHKEKMNIFRVPPHFQMYMKYHMHPINFNKPIQLLKQIF